VNPKLLAAGILLTALGILVNPQVSGTLLYIAGRAPPVKDCWVTDAIPDHNYNGDGLGIGYWGARHRAYITFRLKDLYGEVDPENITGVELQLYGKALFPAKARVYYVVENWDENTITWSNQPGIGVSHFTYGGKSYDISLLGSLDNVPMEEGWFSIPFSPEGVALVKHHLSQGRNLRIVIKGQESPPDSYFWAEDREYKRGAYQPMLVLIYEPEELRGRFWINGQEILGEDQTLILASNTLNFKFVETSGKAETVTVTWTGTRGGSISLTRQPNGEWTGTATLPDGSYTVTLNAQDRYGQTFALSIALTQAGTTQTLASPALILSGAALMILAIVRRE